MDAPWTHSWEEVAGELDVSREEGLTPSQIEDRKEKYGPNRLRTKERKPASAVFIDQWKNLVVLLLAAASAVSFVFGKWLDGIAIAIAVLISVGLGFFTELKAIRSMEALRRMGSAKAKAIRKGDLNEIPAEELVPGDLIALEAGDVIPADIRLYEASKLKIDESALTGESVPVEKGVEPVEDADLPLAERNNMAYKGTAVTGGSGKGVVVATGMDTELGNIASMAEEAEEEETPLEKRLDHLSHRLIWATLIIGGAVGLIGFFTQDDAFRILETAVVLAVAAIPEGLPIVATIALARGMWRMLEHNAQINRLSAVETLGATTVICADKTGTLTENRMTVSRIYLPSESTGNRRQIQVAQENGEENSPFTEEDQTVAPAEDHLLRRALEIGVLCNNAELDSENPKDPGEAVGDPMEVALLIAGARAKMYRKQLLEEHPEAKEVAFDPSVKMMATVHEANDRYQIAVKGAAEAVLEACSRIQVNGEDRELDSKHRDKWIDLTLEMAQTGLRVLAAAAKQTDDPDTDPYSDLTFVSLFGLMDPPRGDMDRSIAECRKAGIRVVMVTGDHPETARSIGDQVGIAEEREPVVEKGEKLKPPDEMSDSDRDSLLETPIFARVSPKQKLNLVQLHQKGGDIVAMTGDGVNDAPALQKADIGIAMGQRGTQVARDAADMVLKDDAFSSIVVAVEQGRIIFDNIRKFILYLLSGNMGEIMIVAFALPFNVPIPLLPLQILYLNMIGDVFPALALGLGEGDKQVMERPPRDPEEPIMTKSHWTAIIGYGLLISLTVLGAFFVALNWMEIDDAGAVTISFLTLAFVRLWHVFNMRDKASDMFHNNITRNRYVWYALGFCIFLLVLAVYVPGLSAILEMTRPGFQGWMLILGASFIPLGVVQLYKTL